MTDAPAHDPLPLQGSCAAAEPIDPDARMNRVMRNLVFVALLATAALSMGCNGIHKRHGGCGAGGCGAGGCGPGGCGGHAGLLGHRHGGGCPDGACGGHGHGGLHDGHGILGHGGHGGHGGGLVGAGAQRGMHGVPHHFSREYVGEPGPPSAQVAYPYYTTRGPRDYFFQGPSTIGP